MLKIITDSGFNLTKAEIFSQDLKELDYMISESYDMYTNKNTRNTTENTEILSNNHKLSYSRPMFDNWVKRLKAYLKKDYDVLYISMTQKFSNSIFLLNTVYDLIKSEFPNGKLVCYDSKTLGRSLGYMVKKATSLMGEGYSLSEIEKELPKIKSNVKTIWLPDPKEMPPDWNPNSYGALTCDDDGNIVPYKVFSSFEEAKNSLENEFKDYSQIEVSFKGHRRGIKSQWEELITDEAILKFRNAQYYGIHPFIFYSLGMNVQEYTFIKDSSL